MIVFWGRADEGPLNAVRAEAARCGAPYVFFDEDQADGTWLSEIDDGFGVLHCGGTSVELAAASAAYMRPYGPRRMRERIELERRPAADAQAAHIGAWLFAWADVAPGVILNRPSLMASNDSKPLQLAALAALGFHVPQTLVTTTPELALAFVERHAAVICKSVGSIRSIVARVASDERDRLAHVAACPTQFQEYIAGVDVRVHAVGDDLFACEINSDCDDYRYSGRSGSHTDIRATTLPPAVAERCHAAAEAFGLPLCGIDLRRTPDDAWYAFEVNPSPGFTYFANAADQPIAAAIASLLARGRQVPHA